MSLTVNILIFVAWLLLVAAVVIALELVVHLVVAIMRRLHDARARARRLVPAPMIALRFGGPNPRPPKMCGECDIEHRCVEHRR